MAGESVVGVSNGDTLDASVFILAGGKGTRMHNSDSPEVDPSLTKILLPVDDDIYGRAPMVVQALERVSKLSPERVVLLTSSDPLADGDGVEAYAQDWNDSAHDISLTFVREERPLGTAGAVRNGLEEIDLLEDSTALIVPSDVILPWQAFPHIVLQHREAESDTTWALTSNPGPQAQNTGRIIVDDESGRVLRSLENEPKEDPASHIELGKRQGMTSIGVVVVNSLAFIETYDTQFGDMHGARPVDIYREYIPAMIDNGIPVQSFDVGVPAQDLGTAERLLRFGRN